MAHDCSPQSMRVVADWIKKKMREKNGERRRKEKLRKSFKLIIKPLYITSSVTTFVLHYCDGSRFLGIFILFIRNYLKRLFNFSFVIVEIFWSFCGALRQIIALMMTICNNLCYNGCLMSCTCDARHNLNPKLFADQDKFFIFWRVKFYMLRCKL